MPREASNDDGDVSNLSAIGFRDGPGDLRRARWNASVNLAVEEFGYLRTALGPPHLGGSNSLAVGQDQRIGKLRIGVGFRLIVVDGKGRSGIVHPAGANRLHAEKIHGALMILFGGEVNHRRKRWRCGLLSE